MERYYGSRTEQPLQPEITEAALYGGIRFIFPTDSMVRTGAIKAMGAIHLDDRIRQQISTLDLSKGRGSLHWDYYQSSDVTILDLKTRLYFDRIDDGNWLLRVDKAYSEGSSLRTRVAREVGKGALVEGSYFRIRFPSMEDSQAYLQRIGLSFSFDALGRSAQDKAYVSLTETIGDLYESNYRIVNPEDLRDVLITFALQESPAILSQIVEPTYERGGYRGYKLEGYLYPGQSLIIPIGKLKTGPNAEDYRENPKLLDDIFDGYEEEMQFQQEQGDQRKVNAGILSFYLELLRGIYRKLTPEEKDRLFNLLYTKSKGCFEPRYGFPSQVRFENKGIRERREGFDTYSLGVDGVEAVTGNEYCTAQISAQVTGTFDIDSRQFQPSGHVVFELHVVPSKQYEYFDDPKVQEIINATASCLALQEPGYLTIKMGGAKPDTSSNWVIDSLASALLANSDPDLQSMGLSVLEKRPNSGSENPENN